LLILQIGDLLGEPLAERVGSTMKETSVKKTGHIVGGHGTVSNTTFRRFSLDQRLQIKQSARAVADDRHVNGAAGCLLSNQRGNLVRTHGAGCGVLRDIDAICCCHLTALPPSFASMASNRSSSMRP